MFFAVELDGRLQFTGLFTDEYEYERQALVKYLNTFFEWFHVKIFFVGGYPSVEIISSKCVLNGTFLKKMCLS